MESDIDHSKIERLKTGMYDPKKAGKIRRKPSKLTEGDFDIEDHWEHEEVVAAKEGFFKRHFLHVLLIFSAVFFLGALGFAYATLSKGVVGFSSDSVIIEVLGPVSVSAGEESSFRIVITNKNNTALEYTNLTVKFPEGTRSAVSGGDELLNYDKELGAIASQRAVSETVKAVFFGQENSEKKLRVTLEYRAEGSNQIFKKNTDYNVHLSLAAVNTVVDMLKETNSGQEYEFTVNVSSNSVIPLEQVLVDIEYPYGFEFVDAEPKPTYNKNTWLLGELTPSSNIPIKITGILTGEDGQDRVFHTSVGKVSEDNERKIGIRYSALDSTITIKKPFIGVELSIDGKTGEENVALPGRAVRGYVLWENNLDTKIVDGEIEVKLRGNALNRRSIAAGTGGFYRSIDDTIFWDKRGLNDLSVIDVGEKGRVSFTFEPQEYFNSERLLQNPEVEIEVLVRGKRISEEGVPEEVKTFITRKVKFTTEAQFVASSVYFVGPFKNTGPIPPLVERETTYTIIWSIVNTANDLSDVRVRGTFPSYIRWAENIDPANEKIYVNELDGEVVWEVGDVPAGTGIINSPRKVAFQVVLLPSLSQVGKVPVLMYRTKLAGIDQYTGATVESEAHEVSTFLLTDPEFDSGTAAVR